MSPVTNSCDSGQVWSDPQGAAVCERRYKIAKSAISRPLNPDREVLGAVCVQTTEGSRLTSQKWTSQLHSLEGQQDTLQSPHAIGAQWSVSYRIVCMSTTIKYFSQSKWEKTTQFTCDCWSLLLIHFVIHSFTPLDDPICLIFFLLVGNLFPSWGFQQLEFL